MVFKLACVFTLEMIRCISGLSDENGIARPCFFVSCRGSLFKPSFFMTKSVCRGLHMSSRNLDLTSTRLFRNALRSKRSSGGDLMAIADPDIPASVSGNCTLPETKADTSNFLTTLSSSISEPAALLLLNFVTILWGSQHAIIKMALDSGDGMSPAALNLDRFLIAAVLFLPFAPRLSLDGAASSSVAGGDPPGGKAGPVETWRSGLELAAGMFALRSILSPSYYYIVNFRVMHRGRYIGHASLHCGVA